jgi:hypothetical protein
LAIERETKLAPHQFLHNYSKISPLLNGLSRERLKKLVEDHFPIQKQSTAS